MQEEALNLVKQLNIIFFLAEYGRVEIVGSVATNLILNRDIDIHLLTKFDIAEVCDKAKTFLVCDKCIGSVDIENYIEEKEAVCIVVNNYNKWKIEIWITNNEKFTGFKLRDNINALLNSKNRKLIMKMKKYYNKKHLLSGEMSTNIYKAVLFNNVSTINGFEKYIKQNY